MFFMYICEIINRMKTYEMCIRDRQYTYLSSESSIGEDSKWGKRQKFHYIGLSVKLDRRLYTTRTFSFYTTGGGTIDKSVSGKLEQDFIVQKEKSIPVQRV